jgi:hypothetical protein
MANRIWEGRCEDCYNERKLTVCDERDLIPDGQSAELCEDCLTKRRSRPTESKLIPIGLLVSGTWLDAAPVTVVFPDSTRIIVAVKYLNGKEHSGLVRLQFPNQTRWLAGGVYGSTPEMAIFEARHHLQYSYFPGQQITFE